MVKYVIAMEHSDRGNPEDQSMSAHTHYCGVNVPDETGKISQSDKRGMTVNKQYVILRFTEGSPGKAKPADFILPKYILRQIPPFREMFRLRST